MSNDLETLHDYAEIMDDEYGGSLDLLFHIHNRKEYLSDDFASAIEKEYNFQFNYLKENTRLVITEVPYTSIREHIELEFLDDL